MKMYLSVTATLLAFGVMAVSGQQGLSRREQCFVDINECAKNEMKRDMRPEINRIKNGMKKCQRDAGCYDKECSKRAMKKLMRDDSECRLPTESRDPETEMEEHGMGFLSKMMKQRNGGMDIMKMQRMKAEMQEKMQALAEASCRNPDSIFECVQPYMRDMKSKMMQKMQDKGITMFDFMGMAGSGTQGIFNMYKRVLREHLDVCSSRTRGCDIDEMTVDDFETMLDNKMDKYDRENDMKCNCLEGINPGELKDELERSCSGRNVGPRRFDGNAFLDAVMDLKCSDDDDDDEFNDDNNNGNQGPLAGIFGQQKGGSQNNGGGVANLFNQFKGMLDKLRGNGK